MGSYGRNFDFRVMPQGGARKGRFYLGGSTNIPIGAPVKYDNSVVTTALDSHITGVVLATGAQVPVQGLSGVAVYEHAPAAFATFDPFLTTFSDIDFVPFGKALQVIADPDNTKIVFTNTVASTFLQTRAYAGRIMVAGVGGATPTVAVGDILTPGTGNDAAGYWAETGSASNGWLKVVGVDNTRLEIEARFLFS